MELSVRRRSGSVEIVSPDGEGLGSGAKKGLETPPCLSAAASHRYLFISLRRERQLAA